MNATKTSMITSAILTIGVFIFDLLTPLGMAGWLLYLLPLIIASRELPRKYMYAFAAILTAFIALGFIYSPAGVDPQIALFNRSLAVGVIWMTAILLVQRKKAENTLRESNEALQAEIIKCKLAEYKLAGQAFMLANISDAVIGFDLNYRITYFSKSAEKMYGYSAEEVMGRPSIQVFQSSYLGITREEALLQLRNTGNLVVEAIHTKKDGSKVTVESHAVLLYDDHGKPVGLIGINRDITRRKKAEETLKQNEERFKAIAETTPLGIGISRIPDSDLLYVNASYEKAFGYKKGELLHKKAPDVYWDKKDREQLLKTLKKNGYVDNQETRLKRKDGSMFWGIISARPIDFEGQTAILGIFNDITEHKRAEEALWESEERFRIALKNSPILVFNQDKELRYTWIYNPHPDFCTETALGKTDADLFQPDEAFNLTKIKRKVLETGIGVREEVQVILNGKQLFYDLTVEPLRDPAGVVVGITCSSIDITERKRTEAQIREQAALLDKARDAIIVEDLEHHITYWNQSAVNIYGWAPEDAIGKNADELIYKEEQPQLIEAKKSVIERGEWMGELRQRTKVGKEITVESRWTLVQDDGKPKSILIINTDITEKKKLETQFLRAQRMESIGTLAGGIAHDLNNMLTPIMMSLHILKEKLNDEQSQKLLTILEQNARRSTDLIKQVLSFSRGVEGERGERVPLTAKHIITEIEKVAKETFPRNIEIRTEIPKGLWTISGDATQLHQVIMNLCLNARDAIPDGGILKITASNFLIDENYARMRTEAKVGSYVAIAISDTGTGIPPEILDRIFEPFFTTKESGKGTGLGLSTSLAIVKNHGGFMNVDSKVGVGTTFTAYLPAIKAEIQNVEEQQPELPIGHGEFVLVAEDEDSIRGVTISILEMYGYNVLSASDGARAVTMYVQNKDEIKVVLMDMMMPVMDGETSIRAIRKINPEVKVIVVSGLAEEDKLEKIENISSVTLLPKPYTAERLLKVIHEVLSAK